MPSQLINNFNDALSIVCTNSPYIAYDLWRNLAEELIDLCSENCLDDEVQEKMREVLDKVQVEKFRQQQKEIAFWRRGKN